MKRNTVWLTCALLVGGATAGLAIQKLERPNASIAKARAKPRSRVSREQPKLVTRVEDARSDAFRDWLSDLDSARLGEDAILDLLEADLSSAQKNAILDRHLREFSRNGAFVAPERWSQRLTETVLRTDLDLDLGVKAGRILGHVSSRPKLAELESEYRQRGPSLKTGNKLAIVEASRNTEFVSSVLADPAEPLEVRESAVGRIAELGDVHELERLLAPDSGADPTLKVASAGALAENARDGAELTKAIELAKADPAPDVYGRMALSVAQARASESDVDGKSLVLFAEWQVALDQLGGSAPMQTALLQALGTGKAFSRALWTESNPEMATQVIDGKLAPSVLTLLTQANENAALLQALAEFATDFGQECAMRAPEACAQSGDRRVTYAAELSALIRPKLAGALAFYAQRMGP